MTKDTAVKVSYYFCVIMLLAVAWLHMATPLLTILFSYLILKHLKVGKRSWPAVLMFLVVVAAVFYGSVFFAREALQILPSLAENSIPKMIEYARAHHVELPFTDLEGLKFTAVTTLKEELEYVARFAEMATKESVFLIIGLVVAISIFLNGKLDLNQGRYTLQNNLYSHICEQISARFISLFNSFETVMGAQLIISAINTTFTAIFVLAVGLPYSKLVIIITFVVGLLPIVGNLISNTIICSVALMHSPQLAGWALLYLVVLHKFEYFLNSKIIGGRIKNPMWLTLLGLLVGERFMGIPGMILAPVLLHFVKTECSQISVKIPA
jgi:predicted PurR-regulated permease PerM